MDLGGVNFCCVVVVVSTFIIGLYACSVCVSIFYLPIVLSVCKEVTSGCVAYEHIKCINCVRFYPVYCFLGMFLCLGITPGVGIFLSHFDGRW